MIRQNKRASLALCAFAAVAFSGAFSPSFAASPVTAFDPDKDGTIDMNEAKAAAGAAFDKLEKDSDGTLDAKEAKGHVSKKEFKEGDPDNDGTLSKDEYLAIVEKLFKAADVDNEGTLDAKELKSKAGKALLKLLK